MILVRIQVSVLLAERLFVGIFFMGTFYPYRDIRGLVYAYTYDGFKHPGTSVKKELSNKSEIDKLLNDLFIRKQVMWKHCKYENHFFASILRIWGSYSDEA